MFSTKYLVPTLAAAFLIASSAAWSTPASADPGAQVQCKKSKKKKKSKKARSAKNSRSKAKARKVAEAPAPTPAAKPRMNHETVIGMHRRGATQSEIVATAEKFGYSADAADRERMTQAGMPKTLIAKLASAEPAPPKPKGIKLETITSYDDIDFDAVPPPPGTPEWVKQQNARKGAKSAPVASAAPARAQPAVHKASTVRKLEVEEDEAEAPAPSPGRRAIVAAQ